MLENYLNNHIELIRLVAAGSIDDGKSTLIGRLVYDSNLVHEDQLKAIKAISKKKGLKEIDFSLLLDGLKAEREQGITIDAAYYHFFTPTRKFIIADVPGHIEYTRNMATGASNANMAIILADARKGLLSQSKRHLFIASLLGIPHILIVINKMDLANYKKETFEKIKNDFLEYAAKLNIRDLQFMPVSAKKGDMVVKRGKNMNWYNGRTLYDYLENVEIISDRNLVDFRFPIQLVIKNKEKRGYAGLIEGGVIKKGSEVVILPSEKKSKIKKIIAAGKEQEEAFAPQSILINLEDELDISRGEMIVRKHNFPQVSSSLEATLLWFDEQEPLKEGRSYILKHTTQTTRCHVSKIHHQIKVDSLHHKKTNQLKLNDIGRVEVTTLDPLMYDLYSKNRNTGNFILIDELTNNTVAAGIITHYKTRKSLAQKKRGAVLWFTGLSGSGKSTIADKLVKVLAKNNLECERLDGDILRETLNKDLGFSKKDRDTNIERAAFLAGLLSKHNVLVLATFISPFRKQRKMVKDQATNFIEIFVDAPLEVCKKRDPKGLYKKALKGEIDDFTGVSHPYEKPLKPDLHLKTNCKDVDQCVEQIITYLHKKGLIEKNNF